MTEKEKARAWDRLKAAVGHKMQFPGNRTQFEPFKKMMDEVKDQSEEETK